MSIHELLADIDARGLSIAIAGGDLRLQGSSERVDADLVDRIRTAKPQLLRHLEAPQGGPVTLLQRSYLVGRGDLIDLGGGASHVYHEIEGNWDVKRLEAALGSVVARHDALRTEFTAGGGQIVHDTVPVQIRTRDLRALPTADRERARAAYRERASHRVLPLSRPPLVHAEVSIMGNNDMVLHVSHDGLVMDGISMFIFFRTWWQAYQGESPAEPELSFGDYVRELERATNSVSAARSLDWWREHQNDLAPPPELPVVANPATLRRPRFTQRRVRLDPDQWTTITMIAKRRNLTPNAVLLTAYAQTLAYWGAGEQFTINTTVVKRPPIHPRIFDAIGNFSDVMLVRAVVDAEATFAERCATNQRNLRQALDNRHVSGIEILQDISRSGRTTRAPYTFNCAIGYVQPGVDGSALELFGPEVFSVSQTPQVYLNVFAMEQHNSLVVQLDSIDALFPDCVPEALVAGYQNLLESLCDDNMWDSAQVNLLPCDQQRRRRQANDTATTQSERLLWQDIVDKATERPDESAIITTDGVVTYGELLYRAQGAAFWLRERGVGSGDLVGLVMRRGPEQIVGILAALLAGAAYLPVDAGLPAQRRAFLLEDGKVGHVLTNVPGAEPDALLLDGTLPAGTVPLPIGTSVDDLAYVLYTSGTTGQPKGVMVSHRNIGNVVADCTARFGIDATDRFFGISAFNFDLSVYDVFGALSVGAAIVLPDADRAADPAHWLDLCERHGVTVWNSVPAIVEMLREEAAAEPARLDSLRLVMMSGDRIPPQLPAALLQLQPDLEVVSLGGPTETTIWNILHPIDVADDGSRPVPYGRPNRNNAAFIRAPEGWDRPDWIPGEIWAGGVGVARGYHGDAARTAERFVGGLYRTGDMGRYLPDGSIEILGRSDFQIKINGYRIEAGEIEAYLVATSGVRQAVVVRGSGMYCQQLVAHLTAAGPAQPALSELREQLATNLPDYMIPTALVWHETLPLTRNGKIDRGELAEAPPIAKPPIAPHLEEQSQEILSEPPADSIEAELTLLWSRILQTTTVGVDDDMYDIGGNSLIAARMLAEVRNHFGVAVPLERMYEVRTVRLLAQRLRADLS